MRKTLLIIFFIIAIMAILFFYKKNRSDLIHVKSYPSSIDEPTNGKFSFIDNGDTLLLVDLSDPESLLKLRDNPEPATDSYTFGKYTAINGVLYLSSPNKIESISYQDGSVNRKDLEIFRYPSNNELSDHIMSSDNKLIVLSPYSRRIEIYDTSTPTPLLLYVDDQDNPLCEICSGFENVYIRNSVLLYTYELSERHSPSFTVSVNLAENPLEKKVLEENVVDFARYGVTITDQQLGKETKIDAYDIENLLSQEIKPLIKKYTPLELGKNSTIFAAIDNGLVMVDANNPEDLKLLNIATYDKKHNEDRPNKIIVKGKHVFLIHPSGIEEYIYR